MSTNDANKQQSLNIELTEDIAEGIYSNLAITSFTNAEFVLDFVRIMPGVKKAKVKSRVILTPEHTKRLLHLLKQNVEKYEATFGTIQEADNQRNIPLSFGGPKAEA